MRNNDIALEFDTAEYYSLQEASEYLNRKHQTSNITPKKLLKRIYEFDIDNYFYGQGFYLLGTHHMKDIDFLNNLDEKSEKLETYIDSIDAYLIYCDFMPSHYCRACGLLMKLSKRMTGQLLFLNRVEVSDEWADIQGLLKHDELDADPDDIEKFLRPRNIPRNYSDEDYDFSQIKVERSTYLPILPKDYIDEIGLEEALKRINLSVLEHYHFKDYQIEGYEGSNLFYSNQDTIVLKLELTNEDILILRRDLDLLESYIIENKKHIEEPEQQFKKKGVSPRLLKAKVIANAHAQNLWSKDHDKKIRIGEMCELVWNYLVDTEYREMLPERKITLKSWFSSIPNYASEAGRSPS